MRSVLFVLAVLVIGCGGKSRDSGPRDASLGRANVAVILGSIDLDLPDLGPTEDQEEEPKGTPLETPAGDSRPVVTAYAPEYRPDSGPFYEWLDGADLESLPFRLEIAEEIPADVTIYPTFRWDGGEQTGWDGLATLKGSVAAFQPLSSSSPPPPFPSPVEGKGKNKGPKKSHDLVGVTPQIPGAEIIPLILGEQTTVRRRASGETKIPLGYGATLLIPAETEVVASQNGGETVVDVTAGAPRVLLPVLRKLWPVSVERMRLSGDTLVVELDGWKDLTIKVGQ